MTISRAQLVVPELPREAVDCAALGGAVIVCGATLSTRLKLREKAKNDTSRWIIEVLAACVLDAEDKPLMTAEEWDRFAGIYLDAAMALYDTAQRLLGADPEAAEKN